MQFFFRGLLVAAITYFLKLGHNNHGLHIYCSDTGPPTGCRNNGPSMGHRNNGPSMDRKKQWPFYGSYHQWALYRPYDRLAKHGPITDHIMAVNGLELESSVHGSTIIGRC